jgi:hypothetical protein
MTKLPAAEQARMMRLEEFTTGVGRAPPDRQWDGMYRAQPVGSLLQRGCVADPRLQSATPYPPHQSS